MTNDCRQCAAAREVTAKARLRRGQTFENKSDHGLREMWISDCVNCVFRELYALLKKRSLITHADNDVRRHHIENCTEEKTN